MTYATAAPQAPPGPRGLPLLGNLIAIQRDALGLLERTQRYGDVTQFMQWPVRGYLLTHPDDIRRLLVSEARHFDVQSRSRWALQLALGEGLLTSEGEFHLRQRRMIQPVFHHERIAGYAATMAAHAGAHASRWRDGAVVDVSEEMTALTLRIVVKTLLGSDLPGDLERLGDAMTEMNAYTSALGRNPLGRFTHRLPLPSLRRFSRALALIDRVIYGLIHEREASPGEYDDLLAMLIAARDSEDGNTRMTPQQVRDEVITLFIAGHETTANALTWTWYLLSQHPGVEQRLHEEVDAVVGDRLPTSADLPALRFTEQVLTESMRLYPPAWAMARRALVAVAFGGYSIPAGSIIVASQWLTHRDPRWFDEPQAFRPGRWTEEFRHTLPRFAYFPFGGGGRQCIGESFAWMEGILLLATIARCWRLRSVTGRPPGLRPLITLRPRHGMPMTVHRRR